MEEEREEIRGREEGERLEKRNEVVMVMVRGSEPHGNPVSSVSFAEI